MGFVLQRAACPDMLLTPGEWPTRGGGGLMVSDVLQIGCKRLAHTSQEPSRSFTAVTARSCRPPRPQMVAAAARRIFIVVVVCGFFFTFIFNQRYTPFYSANPPLLSPPTPSGLRPPRLSFVLMCS